jgi:hypothetical protein
MKLLQPRHSYFLSSHRLFSMLWSWPHRLSRRSCLAEKKYDNCCQK